MNTTYKLMHDLLGMVVIRNYACERDLVPFINLSLSCLMTATSPGILKRPSSLSTDSLLR